MHPFDRGLICMTSKSDDKHAAWTAVTMHHPLITLPTKAEVAQEEERRRKALEEQAKRDEEYVRWLLLKEEKGGKSEPSGIPSFYQKKLAFDMCQYFDEKARLVISHWCRLYCLRITEALFATISSFHGVSPSVYLAMPQFGCA